MRCGTALWRGCVRCNAGRWREPCSQWGYTGVTQNCSESSTGLGVGGIQCNQTHNYHLQLQLPKPDTAAVKL